MKLPSGLGAMMTIITFLILAVCLSCSANGVEMGGPRICSRSSEEKQWAVSGVMASSAAVSGATIIKLKTMYLLITD